MHAAGAVFHRHRLRPGDLPIDLYASTTRQQIRYFAVDQMTAIELGRDLYRERQFAPGRFDQTRLRYRAHKIASQTYEGGDAAVQNALAGRYRVETLVARSRKTIALLKLVQRRQLGLLRDSHLSLIHISEPTRQAEISYAVF